MNEISRLIVIVRNLEGRVATEEPAQANLSNIQTKQETNQNPVVPKLALGAKMKVSLHIDSIQCGRQVAQCWLQGGGHGKKPNSARSRRPLSQRTLESKNHL